MFNLFNLKNFIILAILVLSSAQSRAVLIGGIEFPQGSISFADSVVNFTVGSGSPTAPHLGAFNALGQPNYAGVNSCSSQPDCTFVSLGSGGTITLQFVDNLLTGSDSNDLDLWIFEVGPDVEDMFVEISVDGSIWLSVGSVGGATSGVDIDAFGYNTGDTFSYVRLRDDPNKDSQSGITVGADIDAVGAISTVRAVVVPEPLSLSLMVLAAGLIFRKRKVR